MHDIEPHFRWRDQYIAAQDTRSPFFGRKYSEYYESNRLYNFFLHPQWDEFGSSTLYLKILFADYESGFALIEMIGEWNDTLHNDIMFLKREVADPLLQEGVHKFVFFCDNVLNFHGADDDYYAEWYDDLQDENGWIALLNTRQHVEEELQENHLYHYLNFGPGFNDIEWRVHKPQLVCQLVDAVVQNQVRGLVG